MDKSKLDLFRKAVINMGFHSTESFEHAKLLLALAEKAKDKKEAEALCSAVIVFSVAYLAQRVDTDLITGLATQKQEEGLATSADLLRRSLQNNLIEKLRLLPTVNRVNPLYLDERLPKTRQLIGLIRLRNRLVHQEGGHLIGTVESLGCDVSMGEDGHLKIVVDEKKMSKLSSSAFQEATVGNAKAVVGLVEEMFEEIDAYTNDTFEGRPSFFRFGDPPPRTRQGQRPVTNRQ